MTSISREKARTIRPALRKLIGTTLYTEGRLLDIGLALGLTRRHYQAWKPEIVHGFISHVCYHSQIKLIPVVSHLAEAFLVEAKSTSLNSPSGVLEAKALAMRQFLSFRADQLNQVYDLAKGFWASEHDEPMYWKMVDAQASDLTARLLRRVGQGRVAKIDYARTNIDVPHHFLEVA